MLEVHREQHNQHHTWRLLIQLRPKLLCWCGRVVLGSSVCWAAWTQATLLVWHCGLWIIGVLGSLEPSYSAGMVVFGSSVCWTAWSQATLLVRYGGLGIIGVLGSLLPLPIWPQLLLHPSSYNSSCPLASSHCLFLIWGCPFNVVSWPRLSSDIRQSAASIQKTWDACGENGTAVSCWRMLPVTWLMLCSCFNKGVWCVAVCSPYFLYGHEDE